MSYASRSLTDCERRYSETEKEALALVWACEKFHAYIYGIDFELVTDHKPLEVIYGPRSKPCARIERWVLRVQPYAFKVRHIPGTQNIADPLSRLLPDHNKSDQHEHEAETYVRFVAVAATPQAITTREIEEASAEDEELCRIRNSVQAGSQGECEKQFLPIFGELCTIGKLVLRGTRIVVPTCLRPRLLALAHEGHLGIVNTKQRLRTKVWWPNMEKEAEAYCKSCHGCQVVSRLDPPEPIRSTPLPPGPWQDLAVDLMGPLPSGHSILVVVDYYSRFYEIEILKSTTTDKIISCLERIFSRHGLPITLKSDNGPQFIAQEFAKFCIENNIEHLKVTARWPQANGEVERQNQSLLKRLKIAQAENKNWQTELNKYLMAYRALPHATTGKSPAELLYGRKMRTKMPDVLERPVEENQEVRDHDAENKGKNKVYADAKRNAKFSEVDLGDSVLVKQDKQNKLTTTFNPTPFTVVSKKGNSLVLQAPSGEQYSRKVSRTNLRNP